MEKIVWIRCVNSSDIEVTVCVLEKLLARGAQTCLKIAKTLVVTGFNFIAGSYMDHYVVYCIAN